MLESVFLENQLSFNNGKFLAAAAAAAGREAGWEWQPQWDPRVPSAPGAAGAQSLSLAAGRGRCGGGRAGVGAELMPGAGSHNQKLLQHLPVGAPEPHRTGCGAGT